MTKWCPADAHVALALLKQRPATGSCQLTPHDRQLRLQALSLGPAVLDAVRRKMSPSSR